MILALACLLFQVTPTARILPVAVSEPAAAAAAPSAGAPTLDAVADTRPAGVTSGQSALVEGESNRSSSSLLHLRSSAASTQNSQSLSTIRVPDVPPAKPVRVIGARDVSSRRNWLMLSLAQHGAATFDAYATRRAVASGAVESDPFMRPFAGSPAIYATIQVGPVALDYVAIRMQRSQNRLMRHTWWLPQAASTGLFVFSGVHNLHLAH